MKRDDTFRAVVIYGRGRARFLQGAGNAARIIVNLQPLGEESEQALSEAMSIAERESDRELQIRALMKIAVPEAFSNREVGRAKLKQALAFCEAERFFHAIPDICNELANSYWSLD